jgi:radical SAM superfamily enzyme YgiQ (UPF0313 family)
MSKVVFIVPESSHLITSKAHPPLGVLYLAAVLRGKHEVEVLDLAGVKNQSKIISGIDADYACITATTPQFPDAYAIRALLPGGCISVIGGVHVTHIQSDGFSFDIIVRGEGERVIKNIVDLGVVQGQYKYPEVADIDTIPFPDRSVVDIRSYKYEIDGLPATTLITSRGCPYACAFCSTIWQKVRFHSAEYVLKELTEIQSYGFDAVNFVDDVFTLKRKRLKTICEGLKERKMSWRCLVSGNTVTEAMFSIMAKSGCKEVGIGIESGSDTILQTVHKCSTSEQNKNAIQMAHDAGIRVKGFIIVGLPGESEDTIAETEAFINESPCDDYDFLLFSPLPNSDIYRRQREYDILHNASKADYRKMWFKGTPGTYEATVATHSLSAIELTEIRKELELHASGEWYTWRCDIRPQMSVCRASGKNEWVESTLLPGKL